MVDINQLYAGIETSLDQEMPLKTMGKKLIINVAPTGTFTSRQQNPQQPYTMSENVAAAIAAYKAGASVWHVHARQDDGLPSKSPQMLKETIDRVLQKCPDFITSVIPYADYDATGVDQITPCVDYLTAAGPEYMRTAVILITTMSFSEKFTYTITRPILTDTVRYLEAHGVKPELQGHSYSALKDTYDWIIDGGHASRPFLTNVMMGFHGFSHASPLGPDPWNYIYMMMMQQTLPSGSIHGICAGGRNWLPFTVMAIMLGFDYVRIGMEDSVFMYPHLDEKIPSNADMVRRVADIARALGREVATPAEAFQIMGLDQPGRGASAPAFQAEKR